MAQDSHFCVMWSSFRFARRADCSIPALDSEIFRVFRHSGLLLSRALPLWRGDGRSSCHRGSERLRQPADRTAGSSGRMALVFAPGRGTVVDL
jgi:hypothetical protein